MNKAKILRAVCELKGPAIDGNGTYGGQGVFISPGHVLTALHVAEGIDLKKLCVVSANGKLSGVRAGSEWGVADEEGDLAILSLIRPISDDFSVVASTPLPKFSWSGVEGYLVTKFKGVSRCHGISMPGFEKPIRLPSGQRVVGYECAIDIEPGYSGSPIVNEKGEVVSVVSGSMNEIMIANVQAPHPDQLAKFYNEKYLRRNLG